MYATIARPNRIEEAIMNRREFRYVCRADLDVATRTGFRMRSWEVCGKQLSKCSQATEEGVLYLPLLQPLHRLMIEEPPQGDCCEVIAIRSLEGWNDVDHHHMHGLERFPCPGPATDVDILLRLQKCSKYNITH
jgi:hypothetical protein